MLERLPRSTAEALDALDHAHAQKRAAEVAEVLAIAAAADLYEVDHEAAFHAYEEQVRSRTPGVPGVGEYLALEIGAILGVSPTSAMGRIHAVLAVRQRHPALWEAVLEGTVWFWQADKIAGECLLLPEEAVARVDYQTRIALRMGLGFGQIMWRLPAWIVEADPELAREGEEQAKRSRCLDLSPIRDGHCQLGGQLDAHDAIAFDHVLDEIADTLPESEPKDHRRAAAVGVLARQAYGQDALPTHELVVHVPAQPDGSVDTGTAYVEGWGDLLAETLPTFLADSKVIVRPVIDPNLLPALDQHDPSASMRLAVTVRNPLDVFPFGNRAAGHCDLDHTIPYRRGMLGQTRPGNLGPVNRRAHRAKTEGRWRLEQPEPGVFHWRSPFGYEYRTTALGTIRLRTPEPRPLPDWDRWHPPDPPEHLPDPPSDDPAWAQPPIPEVLAWVLAHATLTGISA